MKNVFGIPIEPHGDPPDEDKVWGYDFKGDPIAFGEAAYQSPDGDYIKEGDEAEWALDNILTEVDTEEEPR